MEESGASQIGAGDNAELWEEFIRTRDSSLRESLIESYRPIARMWAAKQYAKRVGGDVEFQDYLQLAMLGLIESVDRFRPDKGAQFTTFASYRINGSILNGLEKFSERNQQSSYLRRKHQERVQSLQGDESQSAFEQLAAVTTDIALGVLLEEFCQAESCGSVLGCYKAVEFDQLCERLKVVVGVLPEKERYVIEEHYFHDRSFAEISAALMLSRPRISQLHKNALLIIRQVLHHDCGDGSSY